MITDGLWRETTDQCDTNAADRSIIQQYDGLRKEAGGFMIELFRR